MKKLMIMVALAAITSTAFGAKDTRTAEEYRAIANLMLSETNATARYRIATDNNFSKISMRNDLSTLRLELDEQLAAAGMKSWWRYRIQWPKVSALSRKDKNIDNIMPIMTAISEKYECNMTPHDIFSRGSSLKEIIQCFNEQISVFVKNTGIEGDGINNSFKGCIQKQATKVVRKYLRSQGKSFVTKNGVNPCAEYMDQLNVALNAPRFAGFQEWLTTMGVDAKFDTSYLPSEEEISKLKNNILYGEQPMNEKNRRILLICLGVEGFNAFVKEYNGEE